MAGSGLQQMGRAELPALLAAAARLPHAPVPKAWTVRVMSRAHRLLPSFSAQQLALTAWALGRLRVKLRPDFAAQLLAALKSRLHEASPRALAVAAQGLGALGLRPDGLWAGVFMVRLQGSLARFAGRDLAMVLSGLVRMR